MSHNLESICFSGLIQPHGILLVLSHPELTLLFVSANIKDYLGITPDSLLSQPLNRLLDDQFVEAIRQSLVEIDGVSPIKLQERISVNECSFDSLLHRTEGVIILELEPTSSETKLGSFSISAVLKRALAKLRQVSNSGEFLQLVTQEVRKITEFDRVMVYQFNQHGAGTVMAEAKQDDLPPYLGLRYPTTDIPEQVRGLYARGLLRYIPNFKAQSVELVPASHLLMQQPVDLSFAVLRSVDACCVEYHQNMGAAAILVIALMNEQKLWGLISCHHQTPKYVPYKVREACELLGQFVALELANKVNSEELDYIVKLRTLQSEFVESISQVDNLKQALVNPPPRLLDLVSATGAAVCLQDDMTLVGITPTLEQVRALLQWTDTQVSDTLFYTNSLPALYPEALVFKDVASGLLKLQISKVRYYNILWFRPEVLQTINWAGDPNASIKEAADGIITLSPRKSFEKWQETVRLTSLPWKACELENALDLRSAIVGIVLNKADELARINQELERSNRELDSFVYAASHDLKEPLRGIHNYSTLLLKNYESVLDDVGKNRLQTLVRLTRRMESLIDVLLKFSRLGQAELHLIPTDINQVVNQVLADLRVSRQDIQPDIRIPRSLPTVHCDPVLINEVFMNLLSNAFKYNDQAEQWIEIGYLNVEEISDSEKQQKVRDIFQHSHTPLLSHSPMTFYVRDNGIGIRARHLEIIFRLFKRLHEQNLYGGGTGAGLTIAKKIIERHGGQIWVESTVGIGSTFYFTLG
ncbi:ATP-binding protein [Brasilonema sp. UFV-L1]|uniref:ATP-binding protein n=1 Tax=Brasilonema sp. UFV-L1 TaxID=2234130 RepID=UPI00145CCEA1|nr:ATP-binding protein [Brasilonema sp. UFV-L1]NMG11439.1 cyanobacterial phytochrome A [Brasilonema sp. UFV-L1]